MKLFFAYVRSKLLLMASLAVCFGIFAGALALYRVPWEVIVYPGVLCVLLGLVLLTLDFFRQRRRTRQLERLQSFAQVAPERMIDPETGTEEAYSRLVERLRQESARLQTENSAKYQDMVEYYTVWAHQIKTPIAAMKLTLQNEDIPQSRRLKSDLMRIEQYVDMVLAFLRLDSDSTDYVFRSCSLDAVIRGAVRKFAPEFIERKLRLEYTPVTVQTVTDEKWLSFVLEQIISNALKYTREGSIRIELRDGDTLCISDTGIGIAPEDLPRIFEKGYTGCNGRADKSASGLGLYLCRRVCDNLGIVISAESRPGQGTAVMLNMKQYKLRAE